MILIKKIKKCFSYVNNLTRRFLSHKKRIIILLIIDIILFVVELFIGLVANSLTLFTDSFHLLNDVVSLIISLWAIKLSLNKSPSAKYTYGWQRAEVLGALINGIFLMALCLSVLLQAIQRFFEKEEVHNPRAVFIVGIIGILSNIFGLFLFHDFKCHHKNKYLKDEEEEHKYNSNKSAEDLYRNDISIENDHPNTYNTPHIVNWLNENHRNDSLIQKLLDEHNSHNHAKMRNNSEYTYSNLNMKGVFLHVFGDVLGNISVVITALFIWLTDFSWKHYVDPAISIFISIVIFINALPLVKSSSLILLQVAPKNIQVMEIKEDISNE
ncbi:hypothetical protein T552_00474 [Pneumocystis carinii B80]|uniref:Cation efflux protein transmembrane domain-containing protein n=1 Tax=Pneumocystis carinii (strain B80) TaxID=1408658 RepID=A0A0W4ZQW6_PNEC8|nr:hypothetical protein T552_00474 [Pneumocystis carinii B80]KTW30762.1 hypothetical protein T552_00474 [Pneumocystis carinii B80]